jgi:hypothetical protein
MSDDYNALYRDFSYPRWMTRSSGNAPTPLFHLFRRRRRKFSVSCLYFTNLADFEVPDTSSVTAVRSSGPQGWVSSFASRAHRHQTRWGKRVSREREHVNEHEGEGEGKGEAKMKENVSVGCEGETLRGVSGWS